MIVKFSDSFKGLFSYSAIAPRFSNATNFAIYQGAKPKPDEVIANWPMYNGMSENILWISNRYTYTTSFEDGVTTLTGRPPTSVNYKRAPIKDGRASWFVCILNGSTSGVTPMTTVIPWNTTTVPLVTYHSIIIGDVTEIGGGGFLQVPSLDLKVSNGILLPTIGGSF